MNILFIGDIFAKPGKKAVFEGLPILKEQYQPEIVIANAENIAGGFGITSNMCKKLFRYGVDVITTGNHVWDRRESLDLLDEDLPILRPINYPLGTPGKGSIIFETEQATKVGIINAQGRVFMRAIDDPFRAVESKVKSIKKETDIILVDFHAEATSEKIAMGRFLDGEVSAVVGTHTHVQTADNRVLPGETAVITDVGMSGPHDSVIGVRSELAIEFLLTGRNVRFSPAQDDIRLQGVAINVDKKTGLANAIERIDMEIEGDQDEY